ncbi:MAG: ABC transporter ATP-binding protein [Candidatus Methanofastidiosa archaeon]|nr:ABC transporter ATP-binding protein [Candidatus Methanofastidiosa archaeon]
MVTLDVKGASYTYGGEFSLNDITFSIKEGTICALLGPNASGKTTLIKYLSGMFGYTATTVMIDGTDIATLTAKQAAQKISYVPQVHEASFPYLVLDMVVMGRNPYLHYFSLPTHKDYLQSSAALATLGISDIGDASYTELSGGQQKLVLIARALAQEAPVMLLDEPTAHLDFRNKLHILKTIRTLVKKKGLIALLSLHDPNEAFMVADEVLMMTQGDVKMKGPADTVLTKEAIRMLYGIDVNIRTDGQSRFVVPAPAYFWR